MRVCGPVGFERGPRGRRRPSRRAGRGTKGAYLGSAGSGSAGLPHLSGFSESFLVVSLAGSLIHCLEPSCLDFQAECVGAESAIAVGPKRADRMAGWVGQKNLALYRLSLRRVLWIFFPKIMLGMDIYHLLNIIN